MQDHPPVIDIIQAVRHNPESSFEYWIMLGTIFEDSCGDSGG